MDIRALIADIDSQIAKLQTARTAIAEVAELTKRRLGLPAKAVSVDVAPVKRGRGRPRKVVTISIPDAMVQRFTEATGINPKSGKRTMSPEGRARIAAAQKKRWAAAKKAAKA